MKLTRKAHMANRRRSLVTALYLSTGRLIVAYSAHMDAHLTAVHQNPDDPPPFQSHEPDSCLSVWAGECEKDLSTLFNGEYYGNRLWCTAPEFDRALRKGGMTIALRAIAFWKGIHDLCEQILIVGGGRTLKDLASYKDRNFDWAVETYYDIKHGVFDRDHLIKQPDRNLNL